MLHESAKRSASLALTGVLAFAVAGTAAAAPLPVTAMGQSATPAKIEPVVYKRHVYRRHYVHRRYGHYYRANPAVGAAIAGTALGLIGGAAAAASGYGYPYYGYYGPGYGYGYPGYYYGYGYPGYYYGGW